MACNPLLLQLQLEAVRIEALVAYRWIMNDRSGSQVLADLRAANVCADWGPLTTCMCSYDASS